MPPLVGPPRLARAGGPGFIRVLDDPGDPHWGHNGEFRARLRAEPATVQDHSSLRRTLLQRPWTLDFGSAQWIVAAGIGHLRQRNSWQSADAELRTFVRSVRRSI